MLDVTAVARTADAYQLPIVLSTVGVRLGANNGTIGELHEALPATEENIARTTRNSWEDPDFRSAVKATGRRKIITTGLCGGVSPFAQDHTMQRMVQAGAQPVAAVSLTAEVQRDWGRGGADTLRSTLRRHFPRLGEIRTEAQ